MDISFDETIEFIKKSNNVYVLTHHSPDGDTLGSAFALVNMLRALGKKQMHFVQTNFHTDIALCMTHTTSRILSRRQ